MKRLCAFIVFAILLMTAVSFAEDEAFSELKFVVVKEQNGKPVRNASVILHPVNKDGKQEKGGMQLKTDPEGKTSFNGIPFGKLRVQVIARGFQTFGEDFDINQPQQEIVIKMKPPQEQYSIYK
jgi:uncharacterized GH25 family protein